MDFTHILQTIEEAKIRYLVVGGIAVNLHGIIRPTKDIDFVIYLKKKNVLKFVEVITQLGFIPKVPVPAKDFADPNKRADWIKNKNMIVFSFYNPQNIMQVIDVFVKHPLPFDTTYKRRVKIPIGNRIISVMSIPDLIKLKQKAGRLQDHSDILALRKVEKVTRKLSEEKKPKTRK